MRFLSSAKTLNSINREVSDATARLISEDIDQTRNYLYLFPIIRKFERVGDPTKNIAEEFIFYIEVKVLKHKKMKTENGKNKDSP